MTAAQYAENEFNDNIADDQVYVITDDEMNAYGKHILSVATGADSPSHAAANKKYVDDSIDALSVD